MRLVIGIIFIILGFFTLAVLEPIMWVMVAIELIDYFKHGGEIIGIVIRFVGMIAAGLVVGFGLLFGGIGMSGMMSDRLPRRSRGTVGARRR